MKIVSVILARGGSKGIPRKNLHILNNKPLIYYTIQASLLSNVHETYVSTEDTEIINVAKSYGANIIIRPDKFATDTSSSEEALLHFVNSIDSDIVVFIQPTSPLLSSDYINQGISLMNQYDSVFSVYKEHWIPTWSTSVKPIDWSITNRPRRQDRENFYVENGAFYISKTELIKQSGLRYSGNIGIIEMKKSESFQIDSYEDLELIERLLK